MEWTRTDAARRWIVVSGLVLGPLLVTASAALGIGHDSGSMRAQFERMGANASQILAQDLLEALGFLVVLAALAGAAQALRARGGAVGTIGAVLAVVGTVGLSMSNAAGLAVVALAGLPERDSAFTMAEAISSGGVLATAGTVGFALEVLAQLGIVLVVVGLIRARLVSLWVLLPVVVGIAVNAVVGTIEASLVADVLLLATGAWIAMRLARCDHEQWLGGAHSEAVRRVTVPA